MITRNNHIEKNVTLYKDLEDLVNKVKSKTHCDIDTRIGRNRKLCTREMFPDLDIRPTSYPKALL